MLEAYKKALKNYTNFKDRTTRRDYWLSWLMNIIISTVVGFVFGFIAGLTNNASLVYLSYIYTLAVLIPALAVTVRRLHDINKSGWWILIELVPLVGAIVLLVFECQPSVTENNNYGIQL